jgi:acyl transferase domain-containing protein
MQHLATQNEKPTPKKVQALYQQLCQSREIKQTLSEIEKVGGKAEYCSVNVTDSQQVKATLRPIIQRWGEITGIIHGAGTLADKLIENKTEQDFDKVYSVKIDGLNSLLGSLEVNRLKFIALFSSFVSFYGNIGQSDYSLANEILNKYAYLLQQKYPKCHVVSIGWGPWDGGMVTPQLKQLFEQQNIKVIPQQTGAQMLAEELTQTQAKTPQIIVMSNPISPSPKLVTPQKHSYRLYRRLTLRGNPFVYDHVIGGNAVLPAMCALAWITNSCEQLYQGYRFLSCHNYQVLKGVVFDKSLANLYCLDLTEVDKTEDEIKFEALIWSETAKGIPLYHYRGIINITKQVIAERKLEESIQTVTESFLNLQPYQAGVLFHQPRFQGIKKILEINKNELVFNCYLPRISAQDQGQFSVQSFNSYTADLLFQCLLVWVRKHYNSGSLPLKLNELEQFSSLPFNQEFWIKLSINEHSDTKVIANALAYNSQGKIYLEANNMEVTLSSCLNVLFLNNTVNSSNTVCL